MITIKEDRVRKAAETSPAAKAMLEILFPEFFNRFYAGAQFRYAAGETYLVVDMFGHKGRFVLANMNTGRIVDGVEFSRWESPELTVTKGNLGELKLVHRGHAYLK